MMKKLVILSMAACSIATPAFAQEGDEWTGAYVGVSAGYSSTKSETTATLGGNWSADTQALRNFVTSNAAADQSIDGADFGVQIGYNFHLGSSIVAGLEGEAAYLTGKERVSRGPINFTPTPGLNYTFENRIDPKFSGAIKAKVGIATGPTLVYATGGWAWTRADLGASLSGSNGYRKAAESEHTFDGYIVGGGVEHKFSESISARLEYTYTDQGKANYQAAYLPNSTLQTPARSESYRQDFSVQQVRVGLNFHF